MEWGKGTLHQQRVFYCSCSTDYFYPLGSSINVNQQLSEDATMDVEMDSLF